MGFDSRVGCHVENFALHIHLALLEESCTSVNTPAVIALDPVRPEWSKSAAHLAKDVGRSYRTAVRYIADGIVDVRTFALGDAVIAFRWNSTSAQAAVAAFEDEKSRRKATRYRNGSGVLLQGGAHKRRTVRVAGTIFTADD